MPSHKDSPIGQNHRIHAFEYNDLASVASSWSANDVVKVFKRVDDDNLYWIRKTSGEKNVFYTLQHSTVSTTDATETTVATLDTSTLTDYVFHLEVMVTATIDGGGDAASYKRIGTFKNDSGMVSKVGSITDAHTAEDVAGWDCDIDSSGTNIRVRVTGAAASDINWDCEMYIKAQANGA